MSAPVTHLRVGVSTWAMIIPLGKGKGFLAYKSDGGDNTIVYLIEPGVSTLLRHYLGKAEASRRVGNGPVKTTAPGQLVSMARCGDTVYFAGPRIIYVCLLTPVHGMVFLNTLTYSNSNGEKDGSISDDIVSYRDIRQISAGHNQSIYINDFNTIRILKKDGEVSTLKKISETVSNIVALSGGGVVVCTHNVLVAIVSDSGDIVNIAGHLTAKGTIDGDASTSRFTKITGMVADATNCVYLTDVTEEVTAIRKIDTEKQLTTTLRICPEIINGRLVCLTVDGDLLIAEQDAHTDNKGKLFVVKTACLIPESLKFPSDGESKVATEREINDKSLFDETLDGKAHHDVTFEFRNGNLFAHKFKLMAFPYFRTMFDTSMTLDIGKNAENKYDTTYDFFLELLSYIYTEKMELDINNVFEIMALANSLMIDPVKDECKKFMLDNLSGDVDTLVDFYINVMENDKFEFIREVLHSEVCKNYRDIESNESLIVLLGNENLLARIVTDCVKRKRV